jgi:hypothetical protein
MARQLAAVIDNGTGYTKMGYSETLSVVADRGADLPAMIRRRLSFQPL